MEEDQEKPFRFPKPPKVKLKLIKKTTIFESEEKVRGRELCIEAHANYLRIYPKGSDESYMTTWTAVFEAAAARHFRDSKEKKT